ncbi:MAG: hypothetical protein WA972_09060 [Rhodococcus qingshengii]|jgi:hypothetical protein|uniref:Uncharacterized protein n=1 Tax=Rhodococcus qingshengii JCM 15477 TaxID=1303681 RepID=A0AB38RMP2_RHOSG|nr:MULTISPECIES: hypothetical protein [Rhodococcus]MBW0291209.1 hypothetical protein [Rhodococcus sp. MH15]MDN5585882.1 hypothetical protein [Brevibacterium sp.]UPU46643.1 hypothetical protein M0639_33575 [Rhodococcus qingshengii JCM 15477]
MHEHDDQTPDNHRPTRGEQLRALAQRVPNTIKIFLTACIVDCLADATTEQVSQLLLTLTNQQ